MGSCGRLWRWLAAALMGGLVVGQGAPGPRPDVTALATSGVFAFLGVPAAEARSRDDEDDDEEEDDEDDEEEDDEDEDDDENEEEEEPEEEEGQPPVTAGGLYTRETFPTRELARPLTLSQGLLEARAGVGLDISADTAFESVGVLASLHYGLRDHVEAQFDFDSSYNFKAFGIAAGIEAALAYDVVDFRGALRVSRPAAIGTDGEITSGDVAAAFDIGFPFRYAAKPEIGIVALDTLMSIDLDGSKPDLTPSVGIVTNPIEQVALTVRAQMIVVDFNTDGDNFRIPVSATVQFAATNTLDLGAVVSFPNLKPPDPDGDGPLEAPKFFDNRFVTFFGQKRF
jgi:hypothetical protein